MRRRSVGRGASDAVGLSACRPFPVEGMGGQISWRLLHSQLKTPAMSVVGSFAEGLGDGGRITGRVMKCEKTTGAQPNTRLLGDSNHCQHLDEGYCAPSRLYRHRVEVSNATHPKALVRTSLQVN